MRSSEWRLCPPNRERSVLRIRSEGKLLAGKGKIYPEVRWLELAR
ncbi:hypothetical protein COLO4_36957 [Corchorus olitorius]|uniref:Uncharacterized protein n=1 Tax=Corchorus olitorius TaxID=93759 RepID=A0A1R3G422_9ROSI|nr:hypothetical protein COLO4_36957 [Corchorus olitorius]